MGIRIDAVRLRQIRMPLVHFFETSFGRTYAPRHRSGRGRIATAYPAGVKSPRARTRSTTKSGRIPPGCCCATTSRRECSGVTSRRPPMSAPLTAHIRGHNMARGGLEAAVWDLEARLEGVPLWQEIGGGARREIPCGVSIGIQDSVAQLLDENRDRTDGRISAHQDEDQAGLGCRCGPRGAEAFPGHHADGRRQLGLYAGRRAAAPRSSTSST